MKPLPPRPGTRGALALLLGLLGTGKQRRDDHRTPLGTCPLEPPRASGVFGTFIPIGYPTAAQRRAGYTGSAIGIHGPKRSARWLGGLTALVDWTRGCVAVGTDGQIRRISSWVRDRGVRTVHIL